MTPRKQHGANLLHVANKFIENFAKRGLPVVYTLLCLNVYDRAKTLLPADVALWVFGILFLIGVTDSKTDLWRFVVAFLEALKKSGK